MSQKFIINILLLVLIAGASSCSEFRKIQKSGDWKVKYEAAIDYYQKKDYYRANLLFEEILPLIRGTEEAELANFYYPYSYYYQKQYILSAHYFKTFAEVYGRSEYVMEAQYMHAYSLYMQSPDHNLDQTSTYEAIAALQNFLNRYPFSEYAEKADDLIDKLQVKLETKAYDNTKLYFKLRRYKAALIAAENFRQDYPDSKYNEELAFLSIESAYELAVSSFLSKQEERFRDTVERYQYFVDHYPDSEYLDEAEKFYEDSIAKLTTFADSN